MVSPEVNDRGEVSLEGHLIGSIEGFRFTLARSDDGDPKGLRTAASQVVAPEIAKRAERLTGAPNEEFVLATDGTVRWRGEVVANLAEGEQLLTPRLIVLADESLSGPELERVQDRLNLWLRHTINTQLESIVTLAEPADLEGAARGIAFQLSEHLGLLPRTAVSEEVKGLDQDVRAKMRKLGVKFGAYHIYVPLSLKPKARELALILWALKNGGVRQPGVSDLPQIVLSGRTSFLIDPEVNTRLYEVAGFKVAGKRAVRVDILERLADIIRPLIALDPKRHEGTLPPGAAEGNGFRVTVEMTSLLGTAGEDFASILTSLGYRVRRVPKVEAPVIETPAAEAVTADDAATPAPDAAPAEAPAETAAPEVVAAAAPTEADLADAVVNEAAMDAVEGASAPAAVEAAPVMVEQAAVETATADLGAPAPDAAPDPDAAPEPGLEPEFDEIWSPGGRRPEGARHDNKRPRFNRPAAAAPAYNGEAPAEGAPAQQERPKFRRPDRPEGEAKPARPRFDGNRPNGGGDRKPFEGKGGKPGGPGGGKRFDKPKDDWKEHRPREVRETKIDPDSPWAALAALKNPKP